MECHIRSLGLAMLMVLMALIDLGRSGLARMVRWASMVLSGSLFTGGAGCLAPSDPKSPSIDVREVAEPRDVPPPDSTAEDSSSSDVPPIDRGPGMDLPMDCPPVTYYGPPPCNSDAECQERYGSGWYCDTQNVFTDPCGGSVAWPMCRPGDVLEPIDAVAPDLPVDVARDCEPVVAYGPPPCTRDEDCRPWGQDSYCDTAHPITDPCTGRTWYVCAERPPRTDAVEPSDLPSIDVADGQPEDLSSDEPIVILYGPPPSNPSR